MVRSGPGAGVSLYAITNMNRYAVTGRSARNACCGTMLVHVALICPMLVRLFPLSLGRSAGLRILDDLSLGHSTEDGALNGGRNALCMTEFLTEDGTLDGGRGRSSQY